MPRGGARQGKPGQAYGNRADLNSPKVPTIVPKGAQYGQRQALETSQRVLPPAAGNPGQPAPVGAPATPVGAPGAPGAAAGPVNLPAFNRPSERPGEPVTHGLPIGAGGGPEVMGMPPNNLGQLLDQLSRQPFASPAIQQLAALVKSGRM
jgi:hypothetical protein